MDDRALNVTCVIAVPVAVVCLSTVTALAQRAPPKAVHPARYASPSGEYVLLVDPSDIYGRGPATYRLTRAGKELWGAEKPYTLYNAAVTNDGAAAGYAYSDGLEGFPKERKKARDPGTFIVIILDPAGRERTQEATPREQSRFLHTDPNPIARGMFLDPDNDRFIVRVADPDVNRSREVWWTYALSTGEKLARVERDSGPLGYDRSRSIIDARPVAGTPLTLIHFWRYEYRKGGSALGAHFALVDAADAIVWSLDLPEDYNVPGDKDREDRLRWRIRSAGAILDTGRGAQFDLWFVRDAQRVTFAVTKDGETFRVREVSRAPYAAVDGVQPAAIPERKLTYLGQVELEGATAKPPVRDVLSFDFDGRGRVGLTRAEDAKRSAFVLVEQSGTVVREVGLDAVKKEKEDTGPAVAWLDGERWLVYLSPSGIEAKSLAWFLDAAKGEATAIEGFECPSIVGVDATGDGGFIALGHHRFRYTSENELLAFDREGKKLWSVRKDPKDPKIQFFADAVAVTTSGRVALLQTVRKRIDLYDLKGKYLQSIDLKAAWKRDPNYPSGIAADAEGGFIIEDFHGKSPAVWMDLGGALRLEVPAVKFPDGRAADLRNFNVSPDGRLWATDRSAIVRVAKEGVVDLVLGARPAPDRLEAIAALTTDARGNLYAADARTGAVHVFTREGKRLRICSPATDDFAEQLRGAQVTVTSDGVVYLTGSTYDARYVQFSPRGERLGPKRFGLDSVRERWIAQPTTPNIWVLGYHRIFLVDGEGKVQKTIERRADRRWLEGTGPAAVAPDGSLAVVAITSERDSSKKWSLNLYSPLGEAIRTVPQYSSPLPLCLAYDGANIAFLTEAGTFLLRSSGESLERLQVPEVELDPAASIFLVAREGTELWIAPWKTKRLYRYSLKSSFER